MFVAIADKCPHCGQQIMDPWYGIWGLLIIATYLTAGFLFNRYAHSELHDFTKENKFWCAVIWPLFVILFIMGCIISFGESSVHQENKDHESNGRCKICRGGKHYVGEGGMIHKCECIGGWIPDSEKPKNPPKKR